MTPTQRYSLAADAGPYADWPVQTELLQNGVATGARVPGYVIDAQYDTSLGVLLVTSFDCPFEETYEFTLLDGDHTVLARAALGAAYTTMLLAGHWSVDPLTLALHYQNSLFYTLQLRPPRTIWPRRPRLRLRQRLDWQSDERMCQAHERLRAEMGARAPRDT